MDKPHSKHEHIHAVVRIGHRTSLDDPLWAENSVSGTKAYSTKVDAVLEAERMDRLNGHKGCKYVVVYLRLVRPGTDA